MNEASQTSGKKRSALVTGATGFVGDHLVRRLVKAGWQVHIIARECSSIPAAQEFTRVVRHIHDGSTEGIVDCVAQAKPDVVFHLASLFLAQHMTKDVVPLIQSNVLFGNQLLEAMKVNEVHNIINTGTSWQHYQNAEYNPVCLYAATKQAFEAMLEYYVQACELKAITLKLFDTYGADDLRPKLFNLLSKTAKSGGALDMSAGEQLIDLVHIDDVIDAYFIAAQQLLEGKVSGHERYAVSSGQPLSLKALVQLYSDVTRQSIDIRWGARAYRYREVMVPWNRGKPIAGWVPKFGVKEGILNVYTTATESNGMLYRPHPDGQ